jgi:polyhydroxyalkanoate synthesis regulator phasin
VSDVGQGGFPPITQDTGEPGGPYFESTATGSGTSAADGGSTTDTAKEQAGQVAQDAKESGKQVAGTAVDEGKQVLAEGRRQVQDLTAQAGRQVDEQTRLQKDRAAAGLRDLADELHGMVIGNVGQSGVATELARQAATRVQDVAGWLEGRDPGQLVDELRGIARRRPGAFLLGAVAAGVVAGRLTRGAVDMSRSDDGPAPSGGPPPVAAYRATASGDAATGGPDVDLTSAPVTTSVESTGGRELYAEAGDPLYSSTSYGGNR